MPSKRIPLERLWIFDFDGTLSPLVPDRDAAALLPEGREMLSALVRLPRQGVAVLSSRLLDDLIPKSRRGWALPGRRKRCRVAPPEWGS